jgi:hypothetical protein
VRGEWWLPQDESRKVAGTLNYDPRHGAELILIGGLAKPEWEEQPAGEGTVRRLVSVDSGVYPFIHGSAGSTRFTLHDCFTSYTDGLPGLTRNENVYVNRIFRGGWFSRDEELVAQGMSMGFDKLSLWLLESGISETWQQRAEGGPPPPEDYAFRIEGHQSAPRILQLVNDTTLTLHHVLGIRGNRLDSRAITQAFSWRLNSRGEPRSFIAFLDLAGDLRSVISLCLDQVTSFEGLRYWRDDWMRTLRDGIELEVPIEFFAAWTEIAAEDSKDPLPMVQVPDLGGVSAIPLLMERAQAHRTSLRRVVAARARTSQMSPSERLLSRAASLEAFDRVQTGSRRSTFASRMKRNVEFAGPEFSELIGEADRWISAITKGRNEAAHHLDQNILADGAGTLFLSESLHFLYTMCFLRASDVLPTALQKVGLHSQAIWVKHSLRSYFAASDAES